MATFNLSSMLRESALANPDKPALILDDLRMSYRELDEAFSLLAAGAGQDGGVATTQPDDTAVLLYTSGTTGHPKGAELTHFNVLMNCIVGARIAELRSDDVTLGTLPFFHAFGQSNILNTA